MHKPMANQEWIKEKEKMTEALLSLGYPQELADELANNLGSPKAMQRMTAYLQYVKPQKVELVVDEMLAICSDIRVWKDKKLSEEANARYNMVLNYGFGPDGEDEE